ncbi:hypothetical protein [Trueperella pyogenes]|uniref:hypothetical protein n=1 Tax=Trueperella pyogenes TaxID=1661 RepID=UPI0023DDFE97|nr:hypothetical protein [Trueperella pyogenes]
MNSSIFLRLRREPIVVVAPILVAVGLLHFGSVSSEEEIRSTQRWAQGFSIIFLVGPVASGCAAYIVGCLKDADIFARRWVRERFIVLHALGITATMSFILIIGFGFYQAGFALPNSRLLLVAVMALFQMLAWGVISAFLLPSLLAVPLALVGGYMWMVFPQVVEPLWLRHLNGYWPTCCAIDQNPSLSGLLGVSTVAVSAWLGAYWLIHRENKLRAGISGVVSLVLFFCALFVVSHLEADPVEERVSDLSCQALSDEGVLCLFAEHEKYRTHAEELFATVSQKWSGIIPIGQVRYSESSYDMDALHVNFSPKRPEQEIGMLAQAHLPPFPQCSDRPYENAEARDVAFEGLMSLAGISYTNPDSRVKLLRDLDQAGVQGWFIEIFDRAKRCETTYE